VCCVQHVLTARTRTSLLQVTRAPAYRVPTRIRPHQLAAPASSSVAVGGVIAPMDRTHVQVTTNSHHSTGLSRGVNAFRPGGENARSVDNVIKPVHALPSYVFTCVCLSVCLTVCQQDYSKTTDQIFMKFYGVVGHNPGTNRLDFEWAWPKVKVTRGQKVKIVFCE